MITNEHLELLKDIYDELKQDKKLPDGIVRFYREDEDAELLFELERHKYITTTFERQEIVYGDTFVDEYIIVSITSEGQDKVLKDFYQNTPVPHVEMDYMIAEDGETVDDMLKRIRETVSEASKGFLNTKLTKEQLELIEKKEIEALTNILNRNNVEVVSLSEPYDDNGEKRLDVTLRFPKC